jgi:Bacterial DNA polymerase III alpha NTPase domain
LRIELRTLQAISCAELLLAAQEAAAFCRTERIPIGAGASATSSLVAWALGLTERYPLDHQLDSRGFACDGQPDLPDLDLEVSTLDEPRVARFLLSTRRTRVAVGDPRALPEVRRLRIGVYVRPCVWSALGWGWNDRA